MLTYCGSKVGNKDIDGMRGCGRLQSVICIILVFVLRKIFYTDFCCNERVMISKCKFQVRSKLTRV